MAAVYDVNIRTRVDMPTGEYLFLFKEHALAVGWNLRGSGDGQTRYGYEGHASVPLAERGTGGEFDCLLAAPADNASTDAGDVNAGAWVVLENDGRELLLIVTNQATDTYAGYARAAYSPKGATGFDGSVAGPSTPPGAAPEEHWLFGTRVTASGVRVFTDGPGYLHLWGDDTPENGALALAFATFGDDLSPDGALSIAPIVSGTESPSDLDPAGLFYGQSGLDSTVAWNQASLSMETFTPPTSNFYRGNGAADPSGNDRVASIPATFGTGAKFEKGVFSDKAIAWSGSARQYPDTTTGTVGGATRRWAYADVGVLFPFPTATTPHTP